MDQVDSPEIVDDFEIGQDEVVDIKDKEVNKQKLKRRVDQYKVCLSIFLIFVIVFKMYKSLVIFAFYSISWVIYLHIDSFVLPSSHFN